MEIFNFSFTILTWVMLAVTLIAGICAYITGWGPMRVLRRRPDATPDATRGPSVSIVALADGEADPSEFIAAATAQDYDDFEVIIVHEATSSAHEGFAERYAWTPPASSADDETPHGCRGVKFCFYPPGAHALSQKKLALSIGIKAASGEVIVTTDTSCLIPGPMWLAGMMRHFSPAVDMVLGYARYDYDRLPTSTRPLTRFIHLMTDAQWIAEAEQQRAVRGDGHNLAYRRDLFFTSKGFAGTNDLMNGEDDIFVAANSHGGNIAVELADCSTLTPDHGDDTPRILADAREHYRFTARRLPRASFLRQGYASASQWIMLAAAIIAAITSLPNLAPAAVAIVLLAIIWIMQALAYRNMATTLGDSRKWGLAPLLMLLRPIDNFIFDLSRRNRRFSNYTLRRQ